MCDLTISMAGYNNWSAFKKK